MARRNNDLKRAKAKREPRRHFFLYCEGKKTEPTYFTALECYLDKLVRVESIHTGVPMTIAEVATAKLKEIKKSRDYFEKGDQVWAVFDRDEHPNYESAIELCERSGVGVARSNPCFEVWLILHEEDYHRPDDRHEVCRYLLSLRPEYDPDGAKTCNFGEMIARVKDAEERAKKQLEQRKTERAPYGRPSTSVGELTAAIRAAAAEAKPKTETADSDETPFDDAKPVKKAAATTKKAPAKKAAAKKVAGKK
jgi:hypothetical protein